MIILKADAKSLLNEFIAATQGVQYVIPVYQRNYTWKKKHIQKLLKDIEDLLEGKTNSHFIGSIVYVVTSDIFNQREWSIVDGQQRLTSVFLMLYAIRDILREEGQEQMALSLTSQYLENVNAEGSYKLRLKPLVSNDEAFKKIVESDFDSLDKNTLIYQNYVILKNRVLSWRKKEYSFQEILGAINKLYVVYIQLDKEDNAQQIFESINSTGETLKASDLIRNFILMNKEDRTQTLYYNRYWTIIENNLENDSSKLEEFFRFYISLKRFDLISKNDLYEEFVKYWNEKLDDANTEEILLSEILKYSKYYSQLYLSGTIDGAEKELVVLKKIKSNMPAPLLMEFVSLYEDDKIQLNQLKQCIQLINVYIIRRHMCELDTSSITRLFPSILRSVINKCNNDHTDIVDVLKYYLVNQNRNKSSYMPTDDDIKDALSKKNAYVLSHTRTFFDVVEMDSPIEISYKNLTVEHIMPQTPTDYWKSCSGVDEAEYASLVNLIGNLTLADKSTNSKIGNQNFETKKIELGKVGRINLTRDILSCDKWDKEAILERNKRLIDLFIETFAYFDSRKNYEAGNKYEIFFQKGDLSAKAYIYFDKQVEVLPNSEARFCETRDEASESKLKEYLEDGSVIKTETCYKIVKPIIFQSISAASNFIYGGSNNGWEQWKDEDGNIINTTIRSKLY